LVLHYPDGQHMVNVWPTEIFEGFVAGAKESALSAAPVNLLEAGFFGNQ
jgi:hypothetical protein